MSESLLDQIAGEVNAMSEEDIRKAAEKILERTAKARLAANSPERKQKMLDQAKLRRQKDAAILKLAKERGLVPQAEAATV